MSHVCESGLNERDPKHPSTRSHGACCVQMSGRAAALATALLKADRVMFGHQDDLAYGRTWTSSWNGDTDSAEPWWESDIALVCGSLPAVFGFDLGGFDRSGPGRFAALNLDGVPFTKMQGWIRRADTRGALSTCVCHPAM